MFDIPVWVKFWAFIIAIALWGFFFSYSQAEELPVPELNGPALGYITVDQFMEDVEALKQGEFDRYEHAGVKFDADDPLFDLWVAERLMSAYRMDNIVVMGEVPILQD